MKAIDNIKNRRSVRTFLDQPLRDNTIHFIEGYLVALNKEKGPLGTSVHFKRIDLPPGVKVGTYGMIKNPAGYIMGTMIESEDGLLDFGYLLEKMILDFNLKQLGTCWMAGTFKRKDFDEHLGVGEMIPAVTPIGYYESRRFFENMVRKMASSDLRKPASELFFKEHFDAPLTTTDEILEGIRLGPSASNKQPWRVVVDKGCYHFYLAQDKRYEKAFPFNIQLLDIGIAMYHLDYVCHDLGITGKWFKKAPEIKTPKDNYRYIITFKKDKESLN